MRCGLFIIVLILCPRRICATCRTSRYIQQHLIQLQLQLDEIHIIDLLIFDIL